MKPNETEKTENVDSIIRDALDRKNADDILNYSSDPTLFQMMGSTFRGKMRWVSWLAIGMSIIYLCLGIFCAIRFFDTEELKPALAWGGGAMFCIMTVAMIKIWYWLEMGRRSVSREIKRLELQIAMLVEK